MPVSYRSFKHLLGETSLERKCRFIFGLGILLLVSVSFFLYGKKTEELVRMQTTQNARAHVDDALNKYHTKLLFMKDFESVINAIWGDSNSPDEQPKYKARVLSIYNMKDPEKQPADDWERTQLARFVQAAQKNGPARGSGKPGDMPLPLHEGERVSISGCRSAFNVTGKISNVVMTVPASPPISPPIFVPTSGTFQIALLGSVVASASETGTGVVTPTLQSAYTLRGGQYVLLLVPPLQAGSSPPLNDPLLNPANQWIALTQLDAQGRLYYTGEISNWDVAHPAGLVAPRLDACWEISGGDQSFIFGLT